MVYITGNSNFKVEDILDLVHEKHKEPASNPFGGKSFWGFLSFFYFFLGGGRVRKG